MPEPDLPDASSQAASTSANKPVLDDLMLSMDIVDTIRRDRELVEREIDTETRRADLIDRLRDIYRDQGIDVPDRILEEGVKALEEDRFVYKPPGPGLKRKLAEIYATRDGWGRWVVGAALGVALVFAGWYALVERPRAQKQASIQRELTQELPGQLRTLTAEVEQFSRDAMVNARAQALRGDGLAAARSGEVAKARGAVSDLRELLAKLKQTFDVRIVTRRGEYSGVFRIPRNNPTARNYYLVVEAIDADGDIVERRITNEETGKTSVVKSWAVRVPKRVLDDVQADKQDDGIIQNALVGKKARGEVNINWRVPVSGGEITQW